eukprot:UN03711
MTGQYCIGICDMLDARHVNVSVGLAVNKKRFEAYAFVVEKFKENDDYKERYTGQRHKIPPVILQKIASLYPY